MRERPILFTGEMVRAILAGTKTQTRRAVTARNSVVASGARFADLDLGALGNPSLRVDNGSAEANPFCPIDHCQYLHVPHHDGDTVHRVFPWVVPGDRLWVKEAWWSGPQPERAEHDADMDDVARSAAWAHGASKRSSIYMPRWASRLTLAVVSVRVERVQDITEDDARAEGAAWRVAPGGDLAGAFSHCETPINYRAHFRELWDRINAKRGHSWASNPWVWAITFQRIDAEVRA